MIPQEQTVSTHLGEISLLTTGPEQARGTPLILLHGLLATKEFWQSLLPHLPPHWRVLVPDLWPLVPQDTTGHQPLNFLRLADMLEALRLALALPSIHLMAQDLGCLIQLRFAHVYPHCVQRMVWLSPALYPDLQLPAGLRWWRNPLSGPCMSGPLLAQSLRHFYRKGTVQPQQAAAVWPAAYAAFRTAHGRTCLKHWIHWGQPHSLFWDHPQMIRNVRQPSLLLYGEANPYIHYSQVERLGRHLEPSRVVLLSNCSHFPTLDQTTRVSQEVSRFLDSA